MGLFGKKKEPKSEKKKAKAEKQRVYSFINTRHFRGFKRFRLTTYGYEPITEGINKLKQKNPRYATDKEEPKYIFNLDDAKVDIIPIEKGLQVFVNGNHIGTRFIHSEEDEALFSDFADGRIIAVHIIIEYSEELDLFKSKLGKIKAKVADYYHSYLLVKKI